MLLHLLSSNERAQRAIAFAIKDPDEGVHRGLLRWDRG